MSQGRHSYATGSVLMRRASYASLAVAITLISIKIVAFYMTGSVALLSSLIDSTLDLAASIINYLAIRQALVPADREHRFGHGKAEPLAGLAQAAFIGGSSLFLIFEAIDRLVNPVTLHHGTVGIIVMVISLFLTGLLVSYQRFVIRRSGSLAVKADAFHYVTDIGMNLGVIAALILSYNLGWIMADPLIALGIAVYIIYAAWTIASRSFDQLMDRELPDRERRRIEAIARQNTDIIDVYGLRTRASGRDIFIEMHLNMDGGLSLYRAHEIAGDVQRRLREAYPDADILVHQEPAVSE